MKFVFKSLLMIICLAGLVAAGVWFWRRGSGEVQYQTTPLERGEISSAISATGNLKAVVSVLVGSQVSGNIKALYADFNTKVKKDQLVAVIDPAIFQAKVDQVRASVDSARSMVVNAQAVVERAEAEIASARANYANQQANVTKARVTALDAKSKLEHDNTLYKRGIVSLEERDTAQATYDAAVASQEAAQAQADASQHGIKAAQAQRKVAETQQASAKAQVRQAEASLQQSEADLAHTQIKAPVDGTVVARSMDVGQTVAASFQAPTIFEIAQDLTKMQVDTSVDEADVGRVRVDQAASFTVDAYPDRTFHGKVTQIRQAPINVSNVITYSVIVTVSNPDLKLLPGMTATVSILVEKRDDVLKLPSAALRVKLDESGKPLVAGAGAGGRAQAGAGRPASTGEGRPAGAGSGGEASGGAGHRRGEGGKREGGKREGDKPQVPSRTIWTLADNGKPRPVKVQLGISDGSFSAVESGELREGNKVIIGVTSTKPSALPGPGGMGAPGGGGGPGGRGMRF